MLALKKKKEQEAKAKAEAEASGNTSAQEPPATQKVSLLGVGGKKKATNGGGGKKRSPGEIRIQKGT